MRPYDKEIKRMINQTRQTRQEFKTLTSLYSIDRQQFPELNPIEHPWGGTGDSRRGCAAEKSATAAWSFQCGPKSLRDVSSTLRQIYAKKN